MPSKCRYIITCSVVLYDGHSCCPVSRTGSLFKDYQFGLGLICRNSGQSEFAIPAEAVEAPDRVLSQWVVASYRNKENENP